MIYSVLNRINCPGDVKELTPEEKTMLCSELRSFIIENVSQSGGHLASNLGAVELTIALYSVFDLPKDKIIFDVGHQSYVHKILTGRREQFSTLRQFGGLSGFPKRSESPFDCFDTGHSSTSISAAAGMARARDLEGADRNIVAVFGDGALTGGMMYEAICDIGHTKTPVILILNDNTISIEKNVGALAKYLRSLRLQPSYFRSKKRVESFLSKLPLGGGFTSKFLKGTKRWIRSMTLPPTIFDDLGIEYMGPVDGHDIDKMITAFKSAAAANAPVLVHVRTTKGKGYPSAEEAPSKYHGVGKFDIVTGKIQESARDYSSVFGDKLLSLAEKNKKIIAITGAMPAGTGLTKFAAEFPKRFFDVGIAEQHAVTMAAGFAASGFTPVVPLYSSFLQRAYDQTLHDVCLQNLHVVLPVDRAGIVGADGETHQGIYDVAYLSHMPNMSILSPSNFSALEEMLEYAIERHTGPIAIRYPRGNTRSEHNSAPFVYGRAQTLRSGADITLIATGRMVIRAWEVCDILSSAGISCEILELPTIKPLDKEAVLTSTNKTGAAAVFEDGVRTGGLGSAIAELLLENGSRVKFAHFAFPDRPIVHGTVDQLDKLYGLDAESAAENIKKLLFRNGEPHED